MKTSMWVMQLTTLCLTLHTCVAVSQTTQSTSPPTASDREVMPEYIEDFFLSEAVRSENRGETQVTVYAIKQRNNRSSADGASTGLDLEFGVTNRLQLALELPYGLQATPTSETPKGWSSVSTGVLYQFIRSSHPFALSVGAGVEVPLKSGRETAFEPQVLVAKVFGRVQIHASFEAEISGDETSLAYNVAAVEPWPHHFYPTFEFNGRRNNATNSFYLTPGLYRRLPHRLEFGLGMPVGANTHSSRIGVVMNLTWEVGGDEDNDD